MIARLTGQLDAVADDFCIVDVGGVGYQVFCAARTLRNLPRPGETVKLAIVTHVREDHIHLYGFASEQEKQWFALLQTVQGVGAKVALAILSVLAPHELADAIAAGDKASVARASGVGPKLAQRICIELKDKAAGAPVIAVAGEPPPAVNTLVEDAVSALVNLGYKRAEAFGPVMRAHRELGAKSDVSALIRAGLKELAK